MSLLAPGQYTIYNRVLSPVGEKLAITFGSVNNVVTVTPLTGSTTQQWTINPFDATTSTISPVSVPSLQLGFGNDGPTPTSPDELVWTIANGSTGFTIQDGGKTVNWFLSNASDNNVVSFGVDQGIERFRWVFDLVL